jgi:hypothetical protein
VSVSPEREARAAGRRVDHFATFDVHLALKLTRPRPPLAPGPDLDCSLRLRAAVACVEFICRHVVPALLSGELSIPKLHLAPNRQDRPSGAHSRQASPSTCPTRRRAEGQVRCHPRPLLRGRSQAADRRGQVCDRGGPAEGRAPVAHGGLLSALLESQQLGSAAYVLVWSDLALVGVGVDRAFWI